MTHPEYVRMESQGPWWNEKVRANYVLGRRMAAKEGFNVGMTDARVTESLGDELGDYGEPTDRTIRGWSREDPDIPERALRHLQFIEDDILPQLRPYLQKGDDMPGGNTARMGWYGQASPPRRKSSSINWGNVFKTGLALGGLYWISQSQERPRNRRTG